MKIKVISGSVIHHGDILGVGSIIEDIDKENAERLCLNGICELVDVNLEELTKKELIEYAKNLGIEDVDMKNTKAEIIEKISGVDAPITEMP